MSTPLSISCSEPVELFRYLRTLVDTAETSRVAYPKFALVEAYWHIGRIIVEIEQAGQERADYGIHLIETLSDQLTQRFGKGYSLPNMWRFKQFYLAFPILSTNGRELPDLRQYLRQELKWSHYRILMQLHNKQERAFYIQQAADELWSVRQLQHLIHHRYYYRVALAEEQLLPAKHAPATGSLPASSPTPLFIGSSPRSQVAAIKKILLERYVGWAFVAQRQFISLAGKDHWIDLVFFHYVIKRFILIQVASHSPVSLAQLGQLVDGYAHKQVIPLDKPPIALLVDGVGCTQLITTSHENGLSAEETSLIPTRFS